MSLTILHALKSMQDEELVEMARVEGLELTVREVKKLRPLLNEFSISWLFLGIPNDIAQQLNIVLGRKRSKQLIALFTK